MRRGSQEETHESQGGRETHRLQQSTQYVRSFTLFVSNNVDNVWAWPYRVSMEPVNRSIRESVRVELARRDSKQARLAEEIGVSRQYLNDVMRGKAGNVPAVWQKIFDSLGLELVAIPKDKAN